MKRGLDFIEIYKVRFGIVIGIAILAVLTINVTFAQDLSSETVFSENLVQSPGAREFFVIKNDQGEIHLNAEVEVMEDNQKNATCKALQQQYFQLKKYWKNSASQQQQQQQQAFCECLEGICKIDISGVLPQFVKENYSQPTKVDGPNCTNTTNLLKGFASIPRYENQKEGTNFLKLFSCQELPLSEAAQAGDIGAIWANSNSAKEKFNDDPMFEDSLQHTFFQMTDAMVFSKDGFIRNYPYQFHSTEIEMDSWLFSESQILPLICRRVLTTQKSEEVNRVCDRYLTYYRCDNQHLDKRILDLTQNLNVNSQNFIQEQLSRLQNFEKIQNDFLVRPNVTTVQMILKGFYQHYTERIKLQKMYDEIFEEIIDELIEVPKTRDLSVSLGMPMQDLKNILDVLLAMNDSLTTQTSFIFNYLNESTQQLNLKNNLKSEEFSNIEMSDKILMVKKYLKNKHIPLPE